MANIITQTITNDDIDAALAPLQAALGIETGDLAGHVFADIVDSWREMSHYERSRRIAEYLKLEVIYACPDIMDEVEAC